MIPLPYLKLAGLALAAALIAAGGYGIRDRSARADLAECQRVHAEALAVLLRTAQQAEADYRAREAQTTQRQTEALNAAHAETKAARADADRVRAALERLRQRAAAGASGGKAPADPTPAGASAPARGAVDLQTDLLGRIGEAAGQLAAIADERRIAGRACERAYDALTAAQPIRLGPAP